MSNINLDRFCGRMETFMKLSSRILALFLAVLFTVTAFVGCNNGNGGAVTDPPAGSADGGADLGSGSDPNVPEDVPGSDTIKIDASNLSEYKIVLPAATSQVLGTAASDLTAFLSEKFGVTIETVKDSTAAGEKEIVLGLTSREASKTLSADLSKEEYGIAVNDGSIYIVGFNDLYVEEAVKLFKEKYFNAENKEISIGVNEEFYVSPYFIKKLRIDGVDISKYRIIIPDDADILTKYAAENLKNYVADNSGIMLTVSLDTAAETKYEILIGDTNRAADDNNVTAADGEYVLYKNGGKVICQGENIWVGASIGAIIGRFPSEGNAHVIDITDIPTEPAAKKFEFKEAKNAILMICDGMGFNTVDMYKADKKAEFYAEYLPNKGNAYTGSLNTAKDKTVPTDSAASGTALSSGYKTINGYLGVTEEKEERQNIRELAHSKGAKTAVLTTDAITGATPSAFLIHHDDRNDTAIIQERITELLKSKGVSTAEGSLGAEFKNAEVTALKKISKNNSNFFIMMEEGHIDKRSHANDRTGCVNMVERFNDVIAYAIEFTLCHPDTVLIITADHETGGITKKSDGTFEYTVTTHSTQNVPVYALGYGTEYFNDKEVDNTEIPKFIAKIFGAAKFGA